MSSNGLSEKESFGVRGDVFGLEVVTNDGSLFTEGEVNIPSSNGNRGFVAMGGAVVVPLPSQGKLSNTAASSHELLLGMTREDFF
ncbi:hypothetical protein HYV57_01830 [Candidatus Peregrinibacteria bacterium]|nr:hypothetical protein [Candidatus Peregrinibacteria bacterium]